MNRRELKNKIGKEVNDSHSRHTDYIRGRYDAFLYANLLIETLDEPDEREQLEIVYKDILSRREFLFDNNRYLVMEKPTIPKFVADWIEYNKAHWSIEQCLSYDNIMSWDKEKGNENLSDWFYGECSHDNHNPHELTARAWLNGYTVEKENVYLVRLGMSYLVQPLGDVGSDGLIKVTRDKEEAYPFSTQYMAESHVKIFGGSVEEADKYELD